ncbi:DUF2711 family protein [Bacillus sp. P14.5]|uniref:DUF2711 family protein n=1 Tax=Bacillus sp. P14.5 TaxID=1983400 RepID=UPI000DE93422|nr:DUF2711 family protein [Bacillus sp. P14.5]
MSKNYFFPMEPEPVVDKPIKSFLPSEYVSAAIVLHPFVRMPFDWQPEKSYSPHMVFPTKEDSLSIGTPVSWETVKEEAGMESIKELAIGLNMWIGGIYHKKATPAVYNKLNEVIGTSLFPPKEDQLSELLINSYIDFIHSSGSKTVHFEKITYGSGSFIIDEMTTENRLYLCEEPVTLYDEKEEYIFTCYFDEPSSIVTSKRSLEPVFQSMGWEGILCDENTTHAWFLEEYELKRFYSTY